ncbi:MAG TPA: M1 family metallopeptidase [Bacteroidales bacterium]|nr:M1 family metallopeptidase [Bacteroidales bacterium]HRX95796.1 M1 family metallopeptidase [Bacteroidales bacterium]
MNSLKNQILTIIGILVCASLLQAQNPAFYEPVNINKAYQSQTRSRDGKPGANYWQNRGDYKMHISFDPAVNLLDGEAEITYYNNSQDTLKELIFQLAPNYYKKGGVRDYEIEPEDAGQGIKIKKLTVGNKNVNLAEDGEMWYVEQTLGELYLDSPLDYILPDTLVKIFVSWEYTLNAGSHMRTGQVDSSSYFIAYCYPRIGVYDDIDGWNKTPYQGSTEFYNDFGNYDVEIDVPAQFVVWATGQLQNPAQCLTQKYLDRYLEAAEINTLIHIIDQEDIKYRDFTSPDPYVIWNYKAENVTDFAFAMSDHYLWDAYRVKTGPGEDQTTIINTAYDQNSADFFKVIHLAKKSVDYMSYSFPAIPFPYRSITVFNGQDMMEYPMMVNDVSMDKIEESMSLTAHEIFHSYMPFVVGCNEQKYAWMDEGLTSYFEMVMMRELVNEDYLDIYQFDTYIDEIGHERDLPLITPSDRIRPPHYFHNSYTKAVMFYQQLAHETGRDKFAEFLQSFYNTWKGKHPTGYDFLYALADFTDNKYNWLINPWFFELGFMDYGIQNAEIGEKQTIVTLENNGNYPATLYLTATYSEGDPVRKTIKASEWLGNKTFVATFKSENLQSVGISYDIPLDANPANDLYSVKNN